MKPVINRREWSTKHGRKVIVESDGIMVRISSCDSNDFLCAWRNVLTFHIQNTFDVKAPHVGMAASVNDRFVFTTEIEPYWLGGYEFFAFGVLEEKSLKEISEWVESLVPSPKMFYFMSRNSSEQVKKFIFNYYDLYFDLGPMTRIWRPVPFSEGYEASDDGLIRSLDRVMTGRTGKQMVIKGKLLKPFKKSSGSIFVRLGSKKTRRIDKVLTDCFNIDERKARDISRDSIRKYELEITRWSYYDGDPSKCC